MNRLLPDEMIDARLRAYLDDRAEEGAAVARTPEQLALEIGSSARIGAGWRGEGLRTARLAWLVVVFLLVLGLLAALFVGSALRVQAPRVVTVGIDLPLGLDPPLGEPIRNAILLAIDDAGGQAGAFQVQVPPTVSLSDVVGGVPDSGTGMDNMRRMIDDPTVVAVIGPFNSGIARLQIPISNQARLLQCSPSTTDPNLTAATPPPNNFIRVVTTDDAAGAAAARYAIERLGRTTAYVVDDPTELFSMVVANSFAAEFTRLGGTVVSRHSVPGSAVELPARLATVKALDPGVIYFAGRADQGALLLRAAIQAGLRGVPLIGPEILSNGSATTPGSFLNLLGEDARNTYSVFPGRVDGPGRAAFEAGYRARFGQAPTPFASAGHACAEVVLAAIGRAQVGVEASTSDLREAVRAAGVDPAATFDTLVGPVAFDARGDAASKRATVYAYDPATHDWLLEEEIEAAADFAR